MKVVSPSEMKQIDRKTIFDMGIPGCVLMENAGKGTVQIIKDKFKELRNLKVAIVCGRGNNGGDGFVIARWLKNQGAEPHVFLIGNKEDVKGDAKTNLDVIVKMGFNIREIKESKDICKFDKFNLIVDAIFGTGFK
ncbi:MAG TPA: NAD(P)H-hydrate epimerase, partial [bacterium (Candidatus Stahlbacteria)]|nr:NAD(P)H-hydrate epimerase [Candidatus Stahlbacteria bacterium]